jgi:hypothetical protein
VPKGKRPLTVWIAEVQVSPAIAAKVQGKHGLDPSEIAELAMSPPPKAGQYVTDQRGTRLYLTVRTRDKQAIRVVLYPLGDDTWRLASAYVIERGRRA